MGLVEGPVSPEVSVSHANAQLAPRGRLALAQCVVDDGWSLRRAAERFQVSVPTAQRWSGRYRTALENGEADRCAGHRSPRRPADPA